MIVNQQVKVPFSIRTYKDEVICDVVPMEAGHLLLGRPWQYDRKIIYNGLTNEITLTHLGTKFVLHPQTPSQVAKDQLTMKDKRDEEEKLEKREREKREIPNRESADFLFKWVVPKFGKSRNVCVPGRFCIDLGFVSVSVCVCHEGVCVCL